MPRGGARPGTGPKKGSHRVATMKKEQAREALRVIVLARMKRLVSAQISNAEGLKYLVVREKKSGKFLRVTEAMAKAKQGTENEEETIEVWEKDPSVQAFTDLMNRALDKPKEQEQDLNIHGQIDVVEILRQRHARHSRAE